MTSAFREYPAAVLDVHDGDTVHLDVDVGFSTHSHQHVRLLGIQCPEVAGTGVSPDEKAAGVRARLALHAMLQLGPITVRTFKNDQEDGRGRYLGILFVDAPEGRLECNAKLLMAGHAVAYDGKGKAPKWGSEEWSRLVRAARGA